MHDDALEQIEEIQRRPLGDVRDRIRTHFAIAGTDRPKLATWSPIYICAEDSDMHAQQRKLLISCAWECMTACSEVLLAMN
jgi:hypothetical protein